MKIAFLEYEQNLVSGGDSNFLVCWALLLKRFGHEVDVVQYSSNRRKAYCFDSTIQIKFKDDIDINSYDIVLCNNLYLCREHTPREFIEFVYQIQTKTLYVNHERSTLRFLFRGAHMYELMHACDATICYYDNLLSQILPSEKLNKITFGHFYKPVEDKTNLEYQKTTDLLYLARLNRVKGFYHYIEFANHYHNLSPQDIVMMYGYVGSIGQVPFRKMDEMILEIGKDENEQKPNTAESFIHFRKSISDRQKLVDTLKQARFSWNAYNFQSRGKTLYNVIDNGLEAGPLESMLYGCVPIVSSIHKDLQIPISTEDRTKTMKFEDFNCAIFIDDDTSNDELYNIIQEERSSNKKHKNLQLFRQIILCEKLYHDTIISTFEKVIAAPSQRQLVASCALKDIVSQKDMLEKGKIR